MYQVVSVSSEDEPAVEEFASARTALAAARHQVESGHRDIMVVTPDDRCFLFAEFVTLMAPMIGHDEG